MIKLLLLCVILNIANAALPSPAISTTSGVVQGRMLHVGADRAGLDVYEFLGVPYAEPPTGDRRFQKPVPKDSKLSSLTIATKAPPACPQMTGLPMYNQKFADMMIPNEVYDENCLFLNIWTPRTSVDSLYSSSGVAGIINPGSPLFNKQTSPLAVMVWFHGGGFSSGSAQVPVYNASALAAYNNVIVVSVQYRLGFLGFSYLKDETDDMPGNLGLWDQNLALKWVKSNIGAFGGNPDRITLFGESAGAASVGFHLMSDYSNDLFNNAILQSGSPTSAAWSYLSKDDADKRTRDVIDAVYDKVCRKINPSLPASTSFDVKLACVGSVEAEEIVKLQDTVLQPVDRFYGLPFGTFLPVIDEDFVKENPSNMLKSKQFKKPVLLGSNKEESAILLMSSAKARTKLSTPLEVDKAYSLNITDYKAFINEFFVFYPHNPWTTTPLMRSLIESTYMCDGNQAKTEAIITSIIAATSDFAVTCPLMELADVQSNVYMYQFGHRLSMPLWPSWMGSTHTDEVAFFMGFPFTATGQQFTFEPAERLLSRKMMIYLTNFAKYGNPNTVDKGSPNSMLIKIREWPVYNKTQRAVMALFSDEQCPAALADSFYRGYKERECTFWNDIMPTIVSLIRQDAARQPGVLPPGGPPAGLAPIIRNPPNPPQRRPSFKLTL